MSIPHGAGLTVEGNLGTYDPYVGSFDVDDVVNGDLTIMGSMIGTYLTVHDRISNGKLQILGSITYYTLFIEEMGDASELHMGGDWWLATINSDLPATSKIDTTISQNGTLDFGTHDIHGDILLGVCSNDILANDLTGTIEIKSYFGDDGLIDLAGDLSGTVLVNTDEQNNDLRGVIDVEGDMLGSALIKMFDSIKPGHDGEFGDLDGSIRVHGVSGMGASTAIMIEGGAHGDIEVDADIDGDVTVVDEFNGNICGNNLDPGEDLPANIHITTFGPDWTICEELGCVCNALPACADFDCNENERLDICDLDEGTLHDCNRNGTPDECGEGAVLTVLTSSVFACDDSLPRTQKHVLRFTLACDIVVPAPGDVEIRELMSGGGFGPDLSGGGSFTFTVEDGNVLRIKEEGDVLSNETWYGILNTSNWADVAPFEMDYVVVYGDADNSKTTTGLDCSDIWGNRGPASDDSRYDIDGNGEVSGLDASDAWGYRDSTWPEKPSGHVCTLP